MTKTEELLALAGQVALTFEADDDSLRKVVAALREYAATMEQEPVAWLYTCQKPGTQTVYASVDENDSYHWPIDQWKSIVKTPLFAHPPAPQRTPWPIRGVRVEGGTVIITVKGGNDAARWLCGEVLAEHGENK